MDSKIFWKLKKWHMQHYDEVADIYDSRYGEEQRMKYRAVLEAVGIPRNSSILDVGCGTGMFVKEVAELGDCIVGVDLSKKMVKKAKCENIGQQIYFLCADADFLPFVDKAFDSVFSFTLLQNMPDCMETVKNICRVAKKGSDVVLTVTKKAFTSKYFLDVMTGENLNVVRFIDDEGFNDYIAICKVL